MHSIGMQASATPDPERVPVSPVGASAAGLVMALLSAAFATAAATAAPAMAGQAATGPTAGQAPVPGQAPVAGQAPVPGQAPVAGQATGTEADPLAQEMAPGTEPPDGEAPAPGPQPVGPVIPFEPAPLPGQAAPPTPVTGPAAPVDPIPPAPILTVDPSGEIASFPTVPGAAERGLVVPDASPLFAEDGIPALGANILAQAGFSGSAGLQAIYDDNFNRVERDSPLRRGQTTLTPSVSVNLGRALGQQLLFFNARIAQNVRLGGTAGDRTIAGMDGGIQYRLGPSCGGRVQGSYNRNEVGVADFVVRLPTIQERIDFFASAVCSRGFGLTPSITFATGQRRIQGDRRQFADSDYWSLSGSLGYALAGRGQIGVQAGYTEARFPNQLLDPGEFPPGTLPPDSVNGADSWNVAGFISWRFSPNLAANASLGYANTSTRNPLVDDFSGWIGTLGLNYSGTNWGVGANLGRSVNAGGGGIAVLSVVERLSVAANYSGIPRTSFNAGVGYSRIDRRGLFGELAGFGDGSDDVLRIFVRANYQVTRRVSANLGYTRFNRQLPVANFVAKANQVSGGLRMGF